MYHLKFERFKWPCIVFCKAMCKKHCTCCSKSDDDNVRRISQENIVRNTTQESPKRNATFQTTPKTPRRVNNKSRGSTVISVQQYESDTPDIQNGRKSSAGIVGYGHVNDAFIVARPDDTEKGCEKQGLPNFPDSKDVTSVKKRKEKSAVVLFFRDKYSWFVTHKIFRLVILSVMLIVLIFFTIQASKLEPDNEGLKVLKENHVYRIAEGHSTDSFVVSNADQTIIIFIAWGMLQNDMSDCHFSTPKCLGKARWDSNFNPSTPAAQQAMMDLCTKMKGFSDARGSELKIKKDYTTGEWQINCYMENLDFFLQNQTAYRAPFYYDNATAFMTTENTYYDASLFDPNYEDHLEIAISHWLSNSHDYNNTPADFYLFDHLIGEVEDTYTQPLKTDNTKKYGNGIKYVGIQVNTTLKFQTLGYAEGIPVMELWDDFVNEEMKSMPAEMNGAFQTTRWVWHWLIVSRMLAQNALYGIIIGVSLAFPILVIATGNIITGTLATFSMCCSTVCVIGVIPLGGWKLGVLVSLNMCMVVGLTVDYVVHLAEGYTLSLHHDRMSRVRDMLDEMAVSVFFGAITTLGASLFMFLAQLSFFLQFGIFMFSTIGFSLFFSMGMFVTLMGLCGPQGDTGNVVAMFKKLRAKCKGKNTEKCEENGSDIKINEIT